jgi:recombinational DNA repair protein RecT
MAKWQIEKAMKTSKTTGESTPWRTHPDEQSKKTLVKHTYKLLPQTPQASYAVQALNEHEGIDTSPTPFTDKLRSSEQKDDYTLQGDPICVCDDMVEQGVEEYDCPAHGRRSKKGDKK